MRYIYKVLFLIFSIVELITKGNVDFKGILAILLLILLNIILEKYTSNIIILCAEAIIITYICSFDTVYVYMFGLILLDAAYKNAYLIYIAAAAEGIYFLGNDALIIYILFLCICSSYGILSKEIHKKEEDFKSVYDNERRYRYELEDTKNKLLNSLKETAYLAEIKERNRIAQEIHDTVGHSIAGILMQLQASYRLKERDRVKSDELFKKSVDGLADSLLILRNTVRNIKPDEKLGIEYIKDLIDKFSFCPVNLEFNGDISTLPANYIEIISSNIKEALTNASKYSKADSVIIKIDINKNFTRVYIKDNGIGCAKLKEGLGIRGMKERISNAGGSISFSSTDGFLIVFVIPLNKEGSDIFESNNS